MNVNQHIFSPACLCWPQTKFSERKIRFMVPKCGSERELSPLETGGWLS